MSGEDRRLIALLGLPTLGLAVATTVVTTYVPVVASDFTGSTVVIGVIIALEGFTALWLPLLVGAWSDRLRTRIGGRLPFLVVASPVLVAGLVAMGLVGSVAALAAAAFVFFVGYFLAYEPYRALYPDLLGDELAGRAQGTQALWRGAGTGVAILGGGLLLGVVTSAPFVAAAAVYLATVAVFGLLLARRGVPDQDREDAGVREEVEGVIGLLREQPPLRAFLAANALWELSLAALKTFVILYVTRGLGFTRTEAALIVGGVAVLVLVAALAGGKLADRFGTVRVLALALPVYGLGLLVPFLASEPVLVGAAVPFIAAGGGVLMALPYALLMPLMPPTRHGTLTGYFSITRGIGIGVGPLLGGLAISVLGGAFPETEGYQAVWGVCAAAVLVSLLPLRRLRGEVGRR